MAQEVELIEKLRARHSRLLDPDRGALTASIAVPMRLRGPGEGFELLYLLRAQRGKKRPSILPGRNLSAGSTTRLPI